MSPNVPHRAHLGSWHIRDRELRILEHFDLFKYFTAVAGCDIHRAGETKADMIRLPCGVILS